jgi:arsenite methyltransferase
MTNTAQQTMMHRSVSVKQNIRRQYDKVSVGRERSNGALTRKRLGLIELGYSRAELARLPNEAIEKAFSYGNPLDFVNLRAGTAIVDLGSGVGLDCLILAQRLNGQNRLIGLDLTPGMVAKATSCAKTSGLNNVCFGVGDAENIPMQDGSADVIISNGAICLTLDKEKVFREVYRVLQPGGVLSVSDLLFSMPRAVRILSRCLSEVDTSVSEDDYRDAIRGAGFEDIRVRSRRTCRIEQAVRLWGVRPLLARLCQWGHRQWLRPVARYFLKGISCIHLTAIKPDAPSHNSTPYQVPG